MLRVSVSSLFGFFLDRRKKKKKTERDSKLVGRKVGGIWEELGRGKSIMKIHKI